jgi:alpha-tubulin suppressor-like RCC1 family protein
LGYGGYDPQYIPTPVAGINNAIAIATGAFHACAVLKDGTVKCWGEGDECQLGYGGKNDQISPVTVAGINNAISVTVGGGLNSCALLNDGTVKCWGNNNYGQLGDGTEN